MIIRNKGVERFYSPIQCLIQYTGDHVYANKIQGYRNKNTWANQKTVRNVMQGQAQFRNQIDHFLHNSCATRVLRIPGKSNNDVVPSSPIHITCTGSIWLPAILETRGHARRINSASDIASMYLPWNQNWVYEWGLAFCRAFTLLCRQKSQDQATWIGRWQSGSIPVMPWIGLFRLVAASS